MGFIDILLGRTKPVEPDLDVLFAIPRAAYTLQAALGMAPTGIGAVCYKAAEGAASGRPWPMPVLCSTSSTPPRSQSARTSTGSPGSPATSPL